MLGKHSTKPYKELIGGCTQWLKFVVLATWEAEIRRLTVSGQLEQKAETPSQPMTGQGGAYLSSPLHGDGWLR
jgi:hypothetical protein